MFRGVVKPCFHARNIETCRPFSRSFSSSMKLWSEKDTSTALPFNLSSKHLLKSYVSHPVFAQNLIGAATIEKGTENTRLNALTTLPYSVQIPPKDPSVSAFKRLTAIGKEYVKLYKNGILNVWKNHRESTAILKKLSAKNTEELIQSVLEKSSIERIVRNIESASSASSASSSSSNDSVSGSKDMAATEKTVEIQIPSDGNLTRSQYQLLLRTPVDFYKLPLFSLIFAIFFETTPLLVLAVPHIVPSTCLLPRQQASAIVSNNRKILALKELYKDPDTTGNVTKYLSRSVYYLSDDELKAVAKAVNLYSTLIPLSVIPRSYMENSLTAYIEKIRCDDILIGYYGGVWGLSPVELVRACQARAISTEGISDQELRLNLFFWITNFSQGKFDAGFFLFPVSNSASSFTDIVELSNDF